MQKLALALVCTLGLCGGLVTAGPMPQPYLMWDDTVQAPEQFAPRYQKILSMEYDQESIDAAGRFFDYIKSEKSNLHHEVSSFISGLKSDDVVFELYTEKNPKKFQRLRSNDPVTLYNSNFNSSNPTVFIIHGFTGDADHSDWMNLLRDKNFIPMNYNVIFVQWVQLSGSSYSPFVYEAVVTHVPFVGKQTGLLIKMMKEHSKLSLDDVYLVGFSLGAHVAGFAGKLLPGIGRITGIDPAGPFYEKFPNSKRLFRTDAKFVDILHVNGGNYGINVALGHVDFYVNGGIRQPWCIRLFSNLGGCSHTSAPYIYSETIQKKHAIGNQCTNYSSYEDEKCYDNPTNYLGYAARPTPQGIFFVKTLNTVAGNDTVLCDPYYVNITLGRLPDMDDEYGEIKLYYVNKTTFKPVVQPYNYAFDANNKIHEEAFIPIEYSLDDVDVQLRLTGADVKHFTVKSLKIWNPTDKKSTYYACNVFLPLDKQVSLTLQDKPCGGQ